MAFGKIYEEYLQENETLPMVNFKKPKAVMHSCTEDYKSNVGRGAGKRSIYYNHPCSDECQVCGNTLFPSLLNDVPPVVECFNRRVKKLLNHSLTSRFQRYFMWVQGKTSLIFQRSRDLIKYAVMNSTAVNKLLDRYDKIHCSKQGDGFKLKLKSKGLDILESPWLCELMAFSINAGDTINDCSLTLGNEDKLMLSYECDNMLYSSKIIIDLTCSVCSKTVFHPVALKCGHIFCFTCACHAASVSIFHGFELANPRQKCHLCQRTHVYGQTMYLNEVDIMVKKNCKNYWKQRYRDLFVRN